MVLRLTWRALGVIGGALVATACSGTAITQVTGPTGERCQTGFASQAPTVPATGAQVNVAVIAARECSWSVSHTAAWITVTPTSGQGEGAISVTVQPNDVASPRTTAIAVNEAQLTVSQEPAPCRFELNSRSARIAHEGGSGTVGVQTLVGCAWSVSSSSTWVSLATTAGSGPSSVRFDVLPNTGPERSAELMIAGLRFVVVQTQAPTVAPPPAPPPGPTPPPPAPPPGPPPETPPPGPPPEPPPPGQPPEEEEVELNGVVSDLGGSCPEILFTVSGQRVFTHSGTRFRDGSCNSLRNGRQVQVRGVRLPDGSIRADEVKRND